MAPPRARFAPACLFAALTALTGCRADPDDPADVHATDAHAADAHAADARAADAHAADAHAADARAADPRPDCGPIAECFRGLAFADCGGDGPPAVYCSGGPASECLWFTGGCPAAEYPHPGCDPGDDCVGGHHVGWGEAPWTRERGMTLAVAIDSTLDVPADPTLDCACAHAPPCLGRRPLCRTDELDGYRAIRAPAEDGTLPGLVAISVHARGEIAEQTEDHALIVEVDLYADPPRARACLHPASDGPAFGEPICAVDGRVTLDARPATPADIAALRGRVEARFGDVDVELIGVDPPIEDLVLRATF